MILVASAAGRLHAFAAVGEAPHVAVCHFPFGVFGAGLLLSTLEPSRSLRDRHHQVRGGLRHLHAGGLVIASLSCESLAGGDGQADFE